MKLEDKKNQGCEFIYPQVFSLNCQTCAFFGKVDNFEDENLGTAYKRSQVLVHLHVIKSPKLFEQYELLVRWCPWRRTWDEPLQRCKDFLFPLDTCETHRYTVEWAAAVRPSQNVHLKQMFRRKFETDKLVWVPSSCFLCHLHTSVR